MSFPVPMVLFGRVTRHPLPGRDTLDFMSSVGKNGRVNITIYDLRMSFPKLSFLHHQVWKLCPIIKQ